MLCPAARPEALCQLCLAQEQSRPLYEQDALENFSSAACADDPCDHDGGVAPEVLAEKARKRAFLETLPLGAPRGLADSQALHLCTNGDVLLGRASNGVRLCKVPACRLCLAQAMHVGANQGHAACSKGARLGTAGSLNLAWLLSRSLAGHTESWGA